MRQSSFTCKILSILLVCGCFSAVVHAQTDINGIRVRPSPERTRIVFDLSEPVEHKIFTLSNPLRLVIDISNASLKAKLKGISLVDTPITKIRAARRNETDLRIVLDLNSEMKPRSFVLQPIMQYGDRLVVDLYTPEQQIRTENQKAKQISRQMRDVIIAVDAGHGGDDPGALGFGAQEKKVVLAISKRIHQLFAKEAGYRAILIRSGDYYIGLRKRTRIARKNGADLLISIHADAFKTAEARGASVYAISEKGATSETARWLAENENRADLIGGVSLDDKDDLLAGVLLDLSMTASLSSSLDMGTAVLESMSKVTRLHKKQVEQAGFAILKAPDIPSILIETGYISNPKEARALNSRSHQKKLATAIFKGLKNYIEKNPPPGSFLAWKKQGEKAITSYVIAQGDTLTTIAQRYRVTARRLKEINNLPSDVIRIGQVLRIPTT
ncbi:MAG: N-acetylmuramoyl-L-alanine amidase [Gammaproteobacteria bacterium]|nr:N-acetylmuramoyl-L-alanine amidase [Gammaproteobacteria bacterium]